MMKEPRKKMPASVDTDFWVVFCRDESNGRTDSPLCVVPLLFFPRLGLFFVRRPLCFFFFCLVRALSWVFVLCAVFFLFFCVFSSPSFPKPLLVLLLEDEDDGRW